MRVVWEFGRTTNQLEQEQDHPENNFNPHEATPSLTP